MESVETERLLSRAEVAGRLGISPETVTKYVEEKRLPPPCHRLGKTASSDRWTETVIVDFIASSTGRSSSPTVEVRVVQPFFSVKELADQVRMLQKDAFRILVEEGLLQNCVEDKINHYRPTEEAFKTGYFWRIEKYSKKGGVYYQTVITPLGKEPILKILRIKNLYGIVQAKS